jgi:hypothetical protein
MGTTLAIAEIPDQIKALQVTCQAVAEQSNLERLEQAVKATVERGINDDHELRQANDLARLAKAGAAELKKESDPVTSYFHGLHKMALAVVNPLSVRFNTMESTLKGLMGKYTLAQEALQRKRQAELEKAAEDERRRLEAEARKEMRNGNVAAAKAAIEQAENTPTPVLATATPILEGTSFRRPWDAKITDPMLVIKGIADGTIPLSVVKEWDIVFLKKEAAKRGGLQWPGVEAWQGIAPAVRR